MIASGNYNYYLDNESKTIDEIRKLVKTSFSVSVQGLDIHYFSPKKETKTEKLLKEVKEHQKQNGGVLQGCEFPFDSVLPYKKSQTAKKETEGKLFYELDFKFIKQMAERMQSNKTNSKYELWNWKKPMTPKGIEELKQATLRHLIEILEGNYEDDGRKFGHLEAVSNNIMMINYQLNNE